MLNFLKKLLFLIETALGAIAVVAAFTNIYSTLTINALVGFIGFVLFFDGLERLDGPEHGPY